MKNREEICRFAAELEQYAVGCSMKKRVVDAISDVRQSLEQGISQENVEELDKLVEYMSRQGDAQPAAGGVSREEILQKMREYLVQCQNSNRLIEQSIRSDCQVFIQDARRDMQDYTKVEANFEDVTDEGRFCNSFYQVGQKYAQQTNQILNEYAKTAGGNYQNAMQNIKKMLNAIGSDEVTQKDFYQNWDKQQEIVREGCRDEISRTNGGEKEIAGFAQEHVEEVSKIIQKKKRRRLHEKLIPAYVLLAVLVLFLGGKLIQGMITQQPTQEQADTENEEMLEKVGEIVTEQAVSKLGTNVVSKAAGGSSLMVTLPIVIILLIFWYLFMKHVDKKYHVWVCSSVGRYLSEELEKFWKGDPLNARIDDKFQHLDDYMGKQYEMLIGNVLGGVMQKSDADYRQDRLRELCSQWETIKREG